MVLTGNVGYPTDEQMLHFVVSQSLPRSKRGDMNRPIYFIGVPSEAGALNGTREGPYAFQNTLNSAFWGAGYFPVFEDVANQRDFPDIEKLSRRSRAKVRRKQAVAKVADVVARRTPEVLSGGRLTCVLGGDHSVVIGSGRAALEFARNSEKKLGLIWIDAHYDAHTQETTRSHNANGMPLATLLGYGPPMFRPTGLSFSPEQVVHLGAGTTYCEPEEKALLDRIGVRNFSMKELHRDPMPAWIAALALVDRSDLVWVSFDLDAVDRAFAPAVHLQSDGGFDRNLLLWFAEYLQVSRKLLGVDVVEYKPSNEEYDEKGEGKTARLAADFLLTLIGGEKRNI